MRDCFPRLLCVAGALALIVGGCADSPTASTAGTAQFTLLLTDMPGDADRAWVEVTEITLQGSGGSQNLLSTSTGLIELTQLTGGGTHSVVSGLDVPAGTYTQLRFVTGAAALQSGSEIFLTPGLTQADVEAVSGPLGATPAGTLECPSCSQSGLKVKLPGGSVTLESGQQIVVVDFDVSQSFGHEAGNSGRWVMHPVASASKFEVTGTVSGTVSLAQAAADMLPLTCGGSDLVAADLLSSFVPNATGVGSIMKTGTTDASGSYTISFVAPGDWTMGFAADLTFGNGDVLTYGGVTVFPSIVTVTSAGTVVADYTVSTATCTAAPPAGGGG